MRQNRAICFFLTAIASPLAIFLFYLGARTAEDNLFGWLFMGIAAGYLLGGTIYLILPRTQKIPVKEEVHDRSFWLILPGFLSVCFASPIEYLFFPRVLPNGPEAQASGLFIIGIGIVIWIWSVLTLRDLFTGRIQIQAGHKLVQGGPYRFIRHPVYASYLLINCGLAIGFSSLVGLVSVPLLLFPGLVYRINLEERLLTERFGELYRQYAARTKRFIPGVW